MDLEDYFRIINKGHNMAFYDKDTRVNFSINVDNSQSEFPTKNNSYDSSYCIPTWVEILEDVIKVLEASYGYDISPKVYYIVDNPLWDHNYSPAPGREIDRKAFLELLEKHPELNNGGKHQPQAPFFTTTEDDDENIGNS
jgi:hypothetical protein